MYPLVAFCAVVTPVVLLSTQAEETTRSPVWVGVSELVVKLVPDRVATARLAAESTGLLVTIPDHSDTVAICTFVVALSETVTASLPALHAPEQLTTPYQISSSPLLLLPLPGAPLPLTDVALAHVCTPPPETPDTVAPLLPSSPTNTISVSPLAGGLVSDGLTVLSAAPEPVNAASWT